MWIDKRGFSIFVTLSIRLGGLVVLHHFSCLLKRIGRVTVPYPLPFVMRLLVSILIITVISIKIRINRTKMVFECSKYWQAFEFILQSQETFLFILRIPAIRIFQFGWTHSNRELSRAACQFQTVLNDLALGSNIRMLEHPLLCTI